MAPRSRSRPLRPPLRPTSPLPVLFCACRICRARSSLSLRRRLPAPAVVVLTEGRPPARGALEWVQAQVAGGGAGGGRAAKRQRREGSAAPASASQPGGSAAPSASVDSCGGEAGGGELEETADSTARPGTAAPAAEEVAAAGRVVAGIVRRSKEDELLLSVSRRHARLPTCGLAAWPRGWHPALHARLPSQAHCMGYPPRIRAAFPPPAPPAPRRPRLT